MARSVLRWATVILPPVTLDYENLPLFRTNLCIPGKIYGLILSLVRLLQFIYLCWIKNFSSMSSQGGDRCYFVTNYKRNADESLCSWQVYFVRVGEFAPWRY